MKNFVQLLIVSVLGGALTLGAYKIFVENDKTAASDTATVHSSTTSKDEHRPEFVNHSSSAFDSELASSFKSAAKKTVHAVVHVKNLAVSRQPRNLSEYLRGRRGGKAVQGSGSGVIITADGYIVTNNHVIEHAQKLEITLNNNKTYEARVVGADPDADIALLKIDANNLDYLPFGNSNKVDVGEWALAVGNPFNLTSTVTAGIISAKGRDLNEGDTRMQSFIQTDAAINPGNSGGALVNDEGELIGINTAITSRTGSYIGYGFAVPSNNARKIVEDLMEYGNVQQAVLGISAQTLDAQSAREKELSIAQGVIVKSTQQKAKNSGLRRGDLITRVDNQKVKKLSDLTSYIATKRPEDEVQVNFIRNGQEKITRVELSEYKSYTLEGIGLELTNPTDDYLQHFHTDAGVQIAKSLSREYNIPENRFIITAIDNRQVTDVDDVKAIMEDKAKNDPTKITFRSTDGREESYVFRP